MAEAILHRYKDNSNVSGTGVVADIFEAPDGAVAIRWRGEHPAWGIWPDIRDLEAIHGHQGDSVVQYLDKDRLLRSYQRVMPYAITSQDQFRPLMAGAHPEHPDRLRLVFQTKQAWRWWIALLDGSSDAATHTEVAGEIQHQWIDPEGDLWLVHYTPTATSNPGTARDQHDDPEVNR
jgi:hypothetical protein